MANIVSKLNISPNNTEYSIRANYMFMATTSGSGQAYTAAATDQNGNTVSVDSYQNGLSFLIQFHTSPTAQYPTLNVNNLGAVQLWWADGQSPMGKVTADAVYLVTFMNKNSVSRFVITNPGESSTDENVTVGTISSSNGYKEIVMHDGGGSNGHGYTSPYFNYGITEEPEPLYTNYYTDLLIGKNSSATATVGEIDMGRIKLFTGSGDGTSAHYSMLRPHPSTTAVNNLPYLSGTLLSSGGLLVNSTSNINNNFQSNTTYYKCLYRNGHIYSAGIGGSPAPGDGNDYPETASWSNGTVNGPVLTLSSVTTEFPTLQTPAIPSASTSNSGVVTTADQTFGGRKTFYGGIVSNNGLRLYAPNTNFIEYSQSTSGTNPIQVSFPVGTDAMLVGKIDTGTKAAIAVHANTASSPYLMGTGIAFGTDANKYLNSTGEWTVPSGGGGGSVSFTEADFGVMGAFVGFLDDGTTQTPIAVEPARPDLVYNRYGFSRQGVVKPFVETRNAIPAYHDANGNHVNGVISNSQLGSGRVIYVDNFEIKDEGYLIAIPVVFDYAYNAYTNRFDSVPYILLPNRIGEFNMNEFYSTDLQWEADQGEDTDIIHDPPRAILLDASGSYEFSDGDILDNYDPTVLDPPQV